MQEIVIERFQLVLTTLLRLEAQCAAKQPDGDAFMARAMGQPAILSTDERDQMIVELDLVSTYLIVLGFHTSAKVVSGYADELKPVQTSSGARLPRVPPLTQEAIARLKEMHRAIRAEGKTIVFLTLRPSDAERYNFPLQDWEETLAHWSEMRTNVEECSKCFALERFAAAVFHALLIAEFGVIKVAEVFEVQGDKPGWGCLDRLQAINDKAWKQKSALEQKHTQFLTDVLPFAFAIKDSWRNKLKHVDNHLRWMDSDFSPAIAHGIITAVQNFMHTIASQISGPVTAPSA